ncbi:MAG: ubiquinone/menaquinone biosynthesis C-methylase UbiE [Candidatus Nanohaloarchaea archaeon]|jgi:ubiquinone/menaquinone biosynthesis C-methylase UbiE
MRDRPFIVTDEEEINAMMEKGIYPYTTTTERRYIDPESIDYRIYSELKDVLNEKNGEYTLIDIGSSSAEPLEAIAERLEEETGVELNPMAVDVNRDMLERCYQNDRAEPIQSTAQNLPLQSNSVDLLVSNQLNLREEFIEESIDEFNRILDTEGYAVLSTGYAQGDNNYKGLHQGSITSRS